MGIMGIVGLVMALVGAGAQMYAQQAAQKAAQKQLEAGQVQQRQAQDKINQKIAEATSQYQTDKREELQQQEADRISSDIKANVSESQAIRNAQQATEGNVSEDYKVADAESRQNVQDQMNAFADLVSRIRSKGTMRTEENYRTNRYLQDIQFLGRNAQGDWAVAQAKANDALHSRDGLANFGKLLGAAGTAMSLGSAASALGGAGASAGAGASGAAATGAVDAVSGAAPTVANTAVNQAGLWWNGLNTATKAGLLATGSALGAAALANPWRRH